tara:strand:+ start:1138 stop:1782 length:645 start_codon:yes stop_codon:yes gene_type:complete
MEELHGQGKHCDNKVGVIYIEGAAGNFLMSVLSISPDIRYRIPNHIEFLPVDQYERQELLKWPTDWSDWQKNVEGPMITDYETPYKFMLEKFHPGSTSIGTLELLNAYDKTIMITLDTPPEKDYVWNARITRGCGNHMPEKWNKELDLIESLKDKVDYIVPVKKITGSDSFVAQEVRNICDIIDEDIRKPKEELITKHWKEWKKSIAKDKNDQV